MSLKESVLVVTLNISQWTARKKDSAVTREVEESHGASNAGNFNKALISKDVVTAGTSTKEVEMNPLKAIQRLCGSARTYHYAQTLPWADNGDRILPSANYFNYLTQMTQFSEEFLKLIEDFLVQYPALVHEAQKRLGTMFNQEDYPSEGVIRGKFSLSYSFMPIGDASDIRVSISSKEVDRIRAEVSNALNERVNAAVNDLIGRVRDAVGKMAESLTGTTVSSKGKEKEKVFRDSLVGNICELIELLPLLNFTGDPHVDEIADMIRPLCVDPQLLRDDPEVRKEVAERAAAVLPLI